MNTKVQYAYARQLTKPDGKSVSMFIQRRVFSTGICYSDYKFQNKSKMLLNI